MSLSFELNLDERRSDRVFVSIYLAADTPLHLDGVAVQLLDPDREPVSPRLTLPISGTLSGPLVTQAELRTMDELPEGCLVMGTVWWGSEQLHTSCPADPGTQLEQHLRGRALPLCPGRCAPVSLSSDERERLTTAFPWLRTFRAAHRELAGPVDAEIVVEDYDGLCDELGLDEDNAAWLKELLAED